MNKQEIRNHILKTEWERWHETGRFASLWGDVFAHDEPQADNIMEVVRELEAEGYFCLDFQGELTRKGIDYAEKQNLVDAEKVLYHWELRHRILSFLYQLYESKGYSECISIPQLAAELNIDMDKLDEDYRVLSALGYVKEPYPSITRAGIEYWKQHLLLESFKSEFSDLANLKNITPQQRGIKLEKLVSKVLDFAAWQQEANVTTPYEQIDVVVHRNREFYLIECKWEDKPVQADVVDKLFGKLSRRAGTYGILMSMSGFTKGAAACVKDFTNQKIILLFGKSEIEEIVALPNSFNSMLDEKFKELVLRRKVVWK